MRGLEDGIPTDLKRIKARASDLSAPPGERLLWQEVLSAFEALDKRLASTRADVDAAYKKLARRVDAID